MMSMEDIFETTDIDNDTKDDVSKLKVICTNDFIELKDKLTDIEFISIEGKSNEEIIKTFNGKELVFIIAGTRTKGIAKCVKDLGATVIVFIDKDDISNIATGAYIFTKNDIKSKSPFFQIIDVSKAIDSYIFVDDYDKTIIFQILKAILDIVAISGLVNLNIRDVEAILSNAGEVYIGVGEASGEDATIEATKAAINYINGDISTATALLLSIIGPVDAFTLMEVNAASSLLQDSVHKDAEIIWGVTVDESIKDTIKVTIIVTRLLRTNAR